MDGLEIAHRRLHAQHLVGPPLPDPVSVVRHFGAMQAQEYAVAKWSVAQRTTGVDDAAMQKLIDDGSILRTHVLRPTWHFVAADDLGWLQALTGPRVQVFNRYYNRQHGLDDEVAARTNMLIAGALRGGNHLTRVEVGEVLAAGGFPATGNKLAYVVMRAELDGVVANGAMRGRQHTYALVEERVAAARALDPDAALAELTLRYFTAHGPATTKDFAWWSSLTLTQVKRGLALVGDALTSDVVDGRTVWFPPGAPPAARPAALMLQGYDEYVVAFSDTKCAFNLAGASPPPGRYPDNSTRHPIVVDSQLVGFWRRIAQERSLALELDLFAPTTAAQRRALDEEIQRYGAYAGAPLRVTTV
jgi:hypothetical protein